MKSEKLRKHLRSSLSNQDLDVKVSLRRGLNAICAELTGKGNVVFTWGINEF